MKSENELSLADIIDEYVEQEKLFSFDGSRGVQNLCRITHAIGYVDKQYFGQFHPQGSYGDLINFLEDNPGAVQAIRQWIEDQDSEEWKENVESQLNEREENESEIDS